MRKSRMDAVVQMIRDKRTGPTVDEIVQAAKDGLIGEEDAVAAMERDFAEAERYRQEREVPVGLMIEDEATAANPEVRLLNAEAVNLLLRTINALPMRQAQCCDLYYLQGYTQQQIAERLGVSQPMVTQHLAAAKAKLEGNLGTDLIFCPSNAVTYSGPFIHTLMANPIRKQKASRHPMFPFEIWQRWCVGAEWCGNNVYAAKFENRLSEYLADCFDVPPVVGWYTFPKKKR